jgi:hypothetical protein
MKYEIYTRTHGFVSHLIKELKHTIIIAMLEVNTEKWKKKYKHNRILIYAEFLKVRNEI